MPSNHSGKALKPISAFHSSTFGRPKANNNEKNKGKEPVVLDLTDSDDEDFSLWVDTYVPQSKATLSVHPRKIGDVEHWLNEAYDKRFSKYRRVLVLTGPSGAGKTAALKILCAELKIDILEYGNASGVDERPTSQFEEFMARGGMSSSLCASRNSHKQLLLVEDLPNTSHYPTKMLFRSLIRDYMQSPRVRCPLVIILSDVLARQGEGNDAVDSFSERHNNTDAYSLLGTDLLHHPCLQEIRFNPIAKTIMKKALNTILDAKSLSAQSKPPAVLIDAIIANSNGDIRSALMSLQFILKQTSGKKRKRGDQDISGLLKMISTRESSMFLFHALGKVMYAKRWGQDIDEDKKDIKEGKEKQHTTNLKVNSEDIFSELSMDTDMFTAYAEHNFPLYTNTIEECSAIEDYFSFSDSIFNGDLNVTEGSAARSTLLSHYTFLIDINGLMASLPSPVPRRKQILRKSVLYDRERVRKSRQEALFDLRVRDTTSFVTDVIPFQTGYRSPLFQELAVFPAKPASFLPGESLGEREVGGEDEMPELQINKMTEEPALPVGELLFDPDDDIEDD